MPLSLDGFCAHHEGQSHGIDCYCEQYFYIRLIYFNWTIHSQEGKTGSGWTKLLGRQRETALIGNTSYFFFCSFTIFLHFSHRLTLNVIIKESGRSNSDYCDLSKTITAQRFQLAEVEISSSHQQGRPKVSGSLQRDEMRLWEVM